MEQVHAFLLAAASSTDNLLVGVSLARQRRLPRDVWIGTSLANSLGSLLATALAAWFSNSSLITERWCSWLAAAAFAYLGYNEYCDDASVNNAASRPRHSVTLTELAIPMTLNNLAGGSTGGVAGISPFVACFHVFGVSLWSMWFGHLVGTRFSFAQTNEKTAYLYFFLAVMCLWDLRCMPW